MIPHLLDIALIIFFAVTLGIAIYFAATVRRDPWRDSWAAHQSEPITQAIETVSEGALIPPRRTLSATVRDTLARADRAAAETQAMLAVRGEIA